MKFDIDGREYEDYQLSNEQIVNLLNSEDITDMGYDFLMEKVLVRTTTTCLSVSSAASLTADAIARKRWQSLWQTSIVTYSKKCLRFVLLTLRSWLRTMRTIAMTSAMSGLAWYHSESKVSSRQ